MFPLHNNGFAFLFLSMRVSTRAETGGLSPNSERRRPDREAERGGRGIAINVCVEMVYRLDVSLSPLLSLAMTSRRHTPSDERTRWPRLFLSLSLPDQTTPLPVQQQAAHTNTWIGSALHCLSLSACPALPLAHLFPHISAMLARASMSLSRLSAVAAPRLAVAAAAFSSPAEDAAKKMTFGVKSAKAPGAAKENNVKHFKIYRWNPDTKGATTSAVDRRAGRDGRTANGADPSGCTERIDTSLTLRMAVRGECAYASR